MPLFRGVELERPGRVFPVALPLILLGLAARLHVHRLVIIVVFAILCNPIRLLGAAAETPAIAVLVDKGY
jgi:hypothetical protein